MKRPLLWTFCATLMVSGASWLVALLWRTTSIHFMPVSARYILGAALFGATIARVFDSRRPATLIAASAMAIWFALQLAAYALQDRPLPWSPRFEGSVYAHYGLAALVSIPTAALAASLHLRGRRDHPLLWMWISGLVLLGAFVLPLMLLAKIEALAAFVAVVAPFVGGAIVQVLAPYRAIWTCGSGTLIFSLLIIDKGLGTVEINAIIGALLGIGVCVLFGAAGARVAWYVFRSADPRTAPPRVEIPTATTAT